jgi:hypothetical protein
VPRLDPAEWTPRELRHSFVSLLSECRPGIEDISRLVGHSGTHVTELVSRHELRPVIQTGATAMDSLCRRRQHGGERCVVIQLVTQRPRSGPSARGASAWHPRLRWSGAVSCWWAILGLNQ